MSVVVGAEAGGVESFWPAAWTNISSQKREQTVTKLVTRNKSVKFRERLCGNIP